LFASIARVIPRKFGPEKLHSHDARGDRPARRREEVSHQQTQTGRRNDSKAVNEDHAELSVALIGNAEMRKLNARYRKKDYLTDVLSFPAAAGMPGALQLLGDVIISVDKAREQAKERGRSLNEEMTTLLIHGVLHLLGYDHECSAKDARIMSRLEKKTYR
jgi:probable rRNA maturation factor